MNILHIHASPRTEGSHSWDLIEHLFETLEGSVPALSRDTIKLWDENLPEVDERFLTVKAKAAAGETLTNGERVLWSQVENLIARIKTADALVWSLPMWNFSVPYKAKQFIDVVTQYGYLFTFDASGFSGLLEDKPVLLALSRGGSFGPGSGAEAYDHQEPYLKGILGFWGIQDVTVARAENTMGDAEASEASATEARQVIAGFATKLST